VPKPEKAAAAAPAPAAPASAQPGAAQDTSKQQPAATQTSSDGTKQAGSGNAGAGQEMAASDAKPTGEGTAAGTAQPPAKASTAQSGNAQPQVSVEAVEIEGNKIFVAGVADPGSTVRVYANDMVLGEAKTSPVGRFLVESIHELAVGDYIIRADMLAPDGVKVAARAAVPFTRAPGESVAAVASGEADSNKAQEGDAAKAAASGQPSAGGGGSGAQGSAVLNPLDSNLSKQPPTIVAPKLQETTGAVIIRRGDTLWQISRRLYGHGVRYSTIYLANQDQIEDPDLIWPGQIFAVPNETKEGETANMKAIAGQATELPKKAVE
jgi:nucleoid-associated protein YgaU